MMPPTPLHTLMAGFTAEVLLADPRATGQGVRVAVIDTGVDVTRLMASRTTAKPVETMAFRGADPKPILNPTKPSGPHGTTVADVILRLAPDITLLSADVFAPGGYCELETVLQAVRYAVTEWKAKVVNVSLGVSEHAIQPVQRLQAFRRVIEEAYLADVLVFAAAPNDHPHSRSYPASFTAPLISVDKGAFEEPQAFGYELASGIEFKAYGKGYLGAFAKEPATSWATPHLAGLASRLLSWKPDLKPFEVKTLLYWMSQK